MNPPEAPPRTPSPSTSPVSLDEALSVFVGLRPRLFGIAYRIVGSTAEAEDVLQEVWVRWQKTDRSVVVSPAAFLSRATARLAVNVTRSAWSRKRNHTDTWPPDPVDPGTDLETLVQRAEEVDRALLLVLTRLTPAERAVYVLREAFAYPYPDIAATLRLSAVNVRKIASRARRHLLAEPRGTLDTGEHRRLRAAFAAAARHGDIASLERVLVPRPPARRGTMTPA
nr:MULTISPECIES: sigma-70 family RNA polymerase sigma factor [unclassified Streptomyces]